MKHLARFVPGLVVFVITMGIAVKSFSTEPLSIRILNASATILGPPGSGISGEAFFRETVDNGKFTPVTEIRVDVRVQGLQPGKHGIHIHEVGNCGNTTVPFGAAGGHFDPGPNGNSNPDTNHPFHTGDLPNLQADANGQASLQYTTSRITLSPGPLSVFDADGSAVIIHLNEDLGGPGGPGSGIAGGPRIACGIIH
jgi:Cu-Zn family superoxide dismutase